MLPCLGYKLKLSVISKRDDAQLLCNLGGLGAPMTIPYKHYASRVNGRGAVTTTTLLKQSTQRLVGRRKPVGTGDCFTKFN